MGGDRPSVVLLHGVQSSRLTWWRIAQDLGDLGWEVHRLDLLGHGDRARLGPQPLSLRAMAADVLDQVPGPVDMVVGHSLGSIVALTAAGLAADYCAAVVAEDPPGPTDPGSLDEVAQRIARAAAEARADPAAAREAALADHPGWSVLDAENSVRNRLRLDVERVTALLRTEPWDLPALVRDCPVPLHLLLASRDSALPEPARRTVRGLLPPDQVEVIDGGHDLHRDRPGLWLHTFLRLAGRYVPDPVPRATPADPEQR